MLLVVTLQIRSQALDAFRQYERHAASVMERHGGAIERVIVLDADPDSGLVSEVHIVRFPDAASFQFYRSDPDLARHASLRQRSVVSTDVRIGAEGPDYHER